MSNVLWCDFGQHPFTTAKEGWVRNQASMKTKTGSRVVDYDICAEHAPNQYGGAFAEPEDDLDRRLKEIETKQARNDREENARLAAKVKELETLIATADTDDDDEDAEYDLYNSVVGHYPPGTTAEPQPTGRHRADEIGYP